jgi:hypothetical protein
MIEDYQITGNLKNGKIVILYAQVPYETSWNGILKALSNSINELLKNDVEKIQIKLLDPYYE